MANIRGKVSNHRREYMLRGWEKQGIFRLYIYIYIYDYFSNCVIYIIPQLYSNLWCKGVVAPLTGQWRNSLLALRCFLNKYWPASLSSLSLLLTWHLKKWTANPCWITIPNRLQLQWLLHSLYFDCTVCHVVLFTECNHMNSSLWFTNDLHIQ